MIFPSLKQTKEILQKLNKLKEIENKKTNKEEKIITDFLENKITRKDTISQLEKEKLYSDYKKNNQEAIKLLVEINNNFSEITKNLTLKEIPLFKLEKRKGKNFFTELFKKEDLTKKQPLKEEVVKKEIEKPIKVKKENFFTRLFKKKEKPIAEKQPERKEEGVFSKIFTKKQESPKKEEIIINKEITKTFTPPKELLPENYQVLIHGFAYAFIKEDKHGRTYVVAEPELDENEKKILEETKTALINKISLADLNNENQMYTLIDKIFKKNKITLDKEKKEKIVYYIIRQVSGLDKIEPLMHDPLIEDIECDGIGIPIFIVHRKYGHIVTNIVYETENELQQFVIKMAHLCKSYVSYASPLLDAILPDGSRVNATLTTNVSTRGPTFTIRKFPQKPLTTIDLVNSETITSQNVVYLWTLLEFKKNMILIGPTAGGKTTLLNVISSFIPDAQRVVSIEDTREINLLLENWIPQITRAGFGPPDSHGKRYGEVTMSDLLKESFRQRPDYLILGEVRGEEMALMFQGMASGHCSLSTVHAKSVEGLVTRVTTPPISLDISLLTSLDIVIVTGFSGIGEGKREVKEIDEIKGFSPKDNKIEYNAIYKSIEKFEEKGKTTESDLFQKDMSIVYKSDILQEICKEHNIKKTKMAEIIENREKFIKSLTHNPPKDHVAFKKLLRDYKKTENFE